MSGRRSVHRVLEELSDVDLRSAVQVVLKEIYNSVQIDAELLGRHTSPVGNPKRLLKTLRLLDLGGVEVSRRRFLVTGLAAAAAGCSSDGRDPAADTTSSAPSPPTSPASSESTEAAVETAPSTTTPARLDPVAAPPYSGLPPFSLGVASGDPDDRSVVLWTRLIGAAGELPEQVALDVANDPEFTDLVHSDLYDAPAGYGNSVHALVEGLDPDRWYFYRFRVGSEVSTAGRTRTLPSVGTADLQFGFSSCQNWESGTYAAHGHLANERLDFFVWLGDYIYEYGPNDQGVVGSTGARVHDSPEATDLAGYRDRYSLYRSDPLLQAHHASHPWFVTWDDHEVDNNHAGLSTQDGQDETAFAQRRFDAHQAWWEHMPVRVGPPTPNEPFVINRTARWGDLATLCLLDGRQFRDPQPTDGDDVDLGTASSFGVQQLGPTARSADQSMLGIDQREWLLDTIEKSETNWTVLANQVMMHGLNAFPGDVPSINPDSWDGYFGERQLILQAVDAADTDVVVLTGDFHAASVGDLRPDPFDADGPIVATEFMAPAISSRFPDALRPLIPFALALNPQVRHFDPSNGFMVCAVSADRWVTTLHTLDDVTMESSAVSNVGSFTVERGTPGVAEIALTAAS